MTTGKYVYVGGDLNDKNVALAKAYEAALKKQRPPLKRKVIRTRMARVTRMLRWAQANGMDATTCDAAEKAIEAYLKSPVHSELANSTLIAYRSTLNGFVKACFPEK